MQKNKKKSFVAFQCTQHKVTAPGVAETPWTNYKACKKMINTINHNTNKNVMLDMKNRVQSCPGKMVVNIVNGTVGLPFFPHPFHLCDNVSNIPNMDLGQRDLRPTFQMISPTLLFKDIFSIDKRQTIINLLATKVTWNPLTGGFRKRLFVIDLASQPKVCKVVEQVMKPLINYVQVVYPSLVCVKLGALQSLPNCPSQYKGHESKLHLDYSSNYPKLAPAQRPVSVILALDPFDFIYLPHTSQTRKDLVQLTVPAGHAIIFIDTCLHSVGPNDSPNHQYQLFGYMVSSANQFPTNRVYKYSWKGATDDLDEAIEYIEMKGWNECVDYVDYGSGEGVEGDVDGGGGKQKSKSSM